MHRPFSQCLYCFLKGNQIGCSQHEWTHNEDPRFPGSMDFDWKYNWELASGCVRNVLAETKIDPAEIAAISTTCMREGILLYDKFGYFIIAAGIDIGTRPDFISVFIV